MTTIFQENIVGECWHLVFFSIDIEKLNLELKGSLHRFARPCLLVSSRPALKMSLSRCMSRGQCRINPPVGPEANCQKGPPGTFSSIRSFMHHPPPASHGPSPASEASRENLGYWPKNYPKIPVLCENLRPPKSLPPWAIIAHLAHPVNQALRIFFTAKIWNYWLFLKLFSLQYC